MGPGTAAGELPIGSSPFTQAQTVIYQLPHVVSFFDLPQGLQSLKNSEQISRRLAEAGRHGSASSRAGGLRGGSFAGDRGGHSLGIRSPSSTPPTRMAGRIVWLRGFLLAIEVESG